MGRSGWHHGEGSEAHDTAVAAPEGTRYDELKQMLEERQRELMAEVQGKIRGVRADGAEKPHEVMDQGETSEVDIQEDIELALIQMKAETLNKINEALARLEDGPLRAVLRMRRRDRGGAPAGAALRGPLQGLRRGPGNRGAARANALAAPRVVQPLLRPAGISPAT